MSDADSTRHAEPLLRVVAGSPTEEELAVVIALVASRSGGPAPQPEHWSLWSRKSRMVRPPLRPGYGAWRGSYMPR